MARSSIGKAKKIILLIWVVSFVSALPWAVFTKVTVSILSPGLISVEDVQVNYLVYNNQTLLQSAWCSIPFNEQSSASLYMMLASTIIYFFAPMMIVTLLYTKSVDQNQTVSPPCDNLFRIGLTLHRNKMARCAGTCGGEEGECQAER